MANVIRVLDENVINRIAAGEVVERPVSVVKELVENALDAGANTIRVDIEEGGKKAIVVRDDGIGMSHDDAFLALERYATSKLQSEKDLVGIATLGFRGEALASIASVSRLRMTTKDADEEMGSVVVVEGGILRLSDRVATNTGTTVEVRSLFYNVPVRRRFLRGAELEAGHVHELMIRFALAFPPVRILYSENGRVKIDAAPSMSTLERIHSMFSKDLRDNLVEVDHSVGEIRIHGYTARPPYGRSNMRSVLTFVNGRSVKDKLLNSAVTKGFSNLMEKGRYPFAVLFLEMPAKEVDVNVHPQKAEVRFVRGKEVFDLVLDGIHRALMGAPFHRPAFTREPYVVGSTLTAPSIHAAEERPAESSVWIQQTQNITESPSHETRLQDEVGSKRAFSSLGSLGRLPHSLLVLHSDKELIILDHHAAHERVLFETLKKIAHKAFATETQDLLIPILLTYSPIEARLLAAHLGLLGKVGFIVEEFGENDFLVRGTPTWYQGRDLEGLFQELISVMTDTGIRGDPTRFQEELLKSMACRASVKESDDMQDREIRSLLEQLDELSCPEVCPHGRPFVVRLPFHEIRKKMGRS
ncbi:MAG: mismatch repair protein MutL [Thermodesulfobacteriota bacterium]|nr:mismatch repair protein MutL [Thermodesulfobacteriota bacterium]